MRQARTLSAKQCFSKFTSFLKAKSFAKISIALWISTASVIAGAADATQYLRLDGALTEDRFGVAVGAAGDLNGDGYADFLVGARYADVGSLTDAGSVYVYSGVNGSLLYKLDGDSAGAWFGVAVAGIGDVNGDGRADFIVGAQFGARADGAQSGAAYVYSGATGTRLYSLYGDSADARFGVSVGGGLDVDGDGVSDFVVGAYLENATYVYSGASGARIAKIMAAGATWYGFATALVPDLNGDRLADIVVAAPQNGAGQVTIYSGADRSVLYRFNGEKSGDWFGFAVAAAGDLNGDGRSEILVGAREASPNGQTNAGSVYVYDGASGAQLKRLDGANTRDAFGTSVSAVGDVNRDGVNDILIGARFGLNASSEAVGAAFVLSGNGYGQIAKVTGATSQDWFGGCVAAVGDTNGDGWLEWVVGAAGADPNGNSNSGRAYLYGLSHTDVAVTAVSAPTSAKAGNTVNISYSVANHGSRTAMTNLLVVNGVVRSSATATLDFLATSNPAFSYTLQSADFSGGRSSVCVKATLSGVTDGYGSDNVKCTQIIQGF